MNPPDRPVNAVSSRAATNLLTHRGPDAFGEWVHPAGHLYFGFRRLSILDLSDAANQPAVGACGNRLLFNGEIYNYQDLRPELEQHGHRFRTTGDTEVLLRALETWGEDALLRLEGMFACVFWDERQGEALIARDPLGIKPLYYWRPPGGGLAVASELKAFYGLEDFEPRLDHSALPEYLRYRTLIGEQTLLEGVRHLDPGTLLRYSPATGALTRRRYWSACGALSQVQRNGDQLRGFRELFRSSVRGHLISDVPVGAQLSGGVDSSLVLAVASRDLGQQMKGFHCCVEEPGYDECPVASRVASDLGVTMERLVLTPELFFSDLVETLTWHMDEPLGHPNAIGVHLVSRLARRQVTVLLSGEGADELFGGYTRYSEFVFQDRLRHSPRFTGALQRLPALNLPIYRAARKHALQLVPLADEAILRRAQFIAPEVVLALLGSESAVEQSEATRRHILAGIPALGTLTRAQLFDIETYLPGLLIRQDKMSMAASIENRVPFVTPRMAAYALNLPERLRASASRQKVLVKRLFEEYAPRKIVYRRKAGFGIPTHAWLRGPRGQARLAALRHANSRLHDCLARDSVNFLLSMPDPTPHESEIIWVLMCLERWMTLFLSKPALSWTRCA